jgi:signal transduction histidine kinase
MSSEWMVNLIDRLVKLVNFEHGSGSALFSAYAPDEAVRASAEQIATLFPKKNIALSFDLKYEGVIMSIDPDSLKMIVSNLVDNAFHYTPDGGSVTVSSLREKDGSLTVHVQDTGIGISPEKQKTMFVKFQRGKGAVAVNEKGMGLGLYVVKKIVEQRGGTIGFETEEGKGTTFHVTIPNT